MAPRAERKLAAILAADVVGYSRLVAADEGGTLARLRALRKEVIEPLIAEYRGRVVWQRVPAQARPTREGPRRCRFQPGIAAYGAKIELLRCQEAAV